jgi:hypothetical protein
MFMEFSHKELSIGVGKTPLAAISSLDETA